jgi:putative ABC transport system substrate-binding protein
MRRVKRREFMVLLGSAAAACPLDAFAQPSQSMRRIGVVMAYTEDDPNGQRQIGAFKERLTALGWIEGNNITVDVRYAGADRKREADTLASEFE